MSEYISSAGITPVYNVGVLRTPGVSAPTSTKIGDYSTLFADLLPNKDIVGGQVAKGFVGDMGTPVNEIADKPGHYEAAKADTLTNVKGLLLLAVDAYDAPRQINVVKGGTVRTDRGALAKFTEPQLKSLADVLKGVYDSTFKTLKF